MTTSFTRIVVILSFLRQALGTPQVPPTQVIIGLSLFITLFIMSPRASRRVYTDAYLPYTQKEINAGRAPSAQGRRSPGRNSCSGRRGKRTSPSF
ncbi:MAG: flagellar type III secretion system pore protein FliP [Desulfobacterales bacterium]|nr:flagellar type III secretion system pore protein FliP [Desulfobacterales bacterium]